MVVYRTIYGSIPYGYMWLYRYIWLYNGYIYIYKTFMSVEYILHIFHLFSENFIQFKNI